MSDNPDLIATEARELTGDAKATGPKTFGRKEEVHALARLLAHGKSVVLLGPPGVGKTAIIQKLLSYLADGRLPELAGARVYEASTVTLCSDTRFTGQQEQRIRAVLAHANPKRIHYVPDVWNLPYAGSYSTKPRGIYDLMRPGIEAGKLVLVGECTQGRWDKICQENAELARDFVTLVIKEPTEDETRDLMVRAAAKLSMAFERQAIDRAYVLTKKFQPSMSFPGKGVELLRRATEAAGTGGRANGTAERSAPIDAPFIENVFAKQSGLPMHMISPQVRMTYEEMHAFLAERVLGQDEAVAAVADLLALYKTGLKDPDRPAGVLLFVGPTGVGKTELAKATSEFLFGSRERMLRVDMSEYKDYHSFEKLIGDPKHQKSGLLTDHVRKHPFSVVLLDEFEKGHPNLADLFLQVFDDGRLTDATGDTVDFRHAILILTSNVGSNVRDLTSSIGFGEKRPGDMPKEISRDVRRALEAAYRPEFLNRIDRILVFHALAKSDMRRIAQRELGKVYRREGLLERDLLLEVDDGVLDLLLDRGFDPKYGARPLKRAIEELIVLPLARAVLSSPEARFQLLRIARKGASMELSFEETEGSRKLANLERRTRVDDGEGNVVRMSLADVRTQLASIYERLAELERASNAADLRRELEELELKAKSPAFWDQAFGKGGEVYRRHRLAIEVRRIDDLRERIDLVHQLVEASFAEGEDVVAEELVAKFARLERQLARAERELVAFDEDDRGDAWIHVRPTGAKDGATSWAKDLASMYGKWAEERKYEVEITQAGGAFDVAVKGPYAFGYLKAEAGGHRLMASPKGKDKRPETYLARVDVRPLAEKVDRRKGERAHERHESRNGKDDEPPIRTYDTLSSRGVRDRRTGYAEGDVKKVLSGRIEGFLEAVFTSK